MTDEEFEKKHKSQRLYGKNVGEMLMEYPFFREGMTCGEFEEEQIAYFRFLDSGGMYWDYKSLWKRRQEGEDV